MAKPEDGERRKTSKLQHLDTLLERRGSIRNIINIYLFKAVINKCLKTNYYSNMIFHILHFFDKIKNIVSQKTPKTTAFVFPRQRVNISEHSQCKNISINSPSTFLCGDDSLYSVQTKMNGSDLMSCQLSK